MKSQGTLGIDILTTMGGTCCIRASSSKSMNGVNTSVEIKGKSA